MAQQRFALGALQDAAELTLRAERRLGEILAGTVVPRGHHGPGVSGARPSLPEGVNTSQSHRWQRVAGVPGAALTGEQLKDHCRGRIAHYKVPRYVVFGDEYPTTVTGKVQKFELRAWAVERLGLQKAAGVETA